MNQTVKLTNEEINKLPDNEFIKISFATGDWLYGCSKGVVRYHVNSIGRSFKNGKRLGGTA